MKQPFNILKNFAAAAIVCTKKWRIKKIRSKEGTFSAPKNGNF
jgi:hypothetical protein